MENMETRIEEVKAILDDCVANNKGFCLLLAYEDGEALETKLTAQHLNEDGMIAILKETIKNLENEK